ncbi:MAG: DUF2207 domain-containing protein [Clostridia bacterium]|nr:DUF2207 domain-containing protein [Clostridia bacterium]
MAIFCAFTPETKSASASSGAGFNVAEYNVHATVHENREVFIKEQITVNFLRNGNEWYRSLPLEGDQYSNISAKCDQNPEFSYYVAANPDVMGFLDINMSGDLTKGKTWVYEIEYTILVCPQDAGYDMVLDVIGAGWPVALNNVRVTVDFPAALEDYRVYSGGYGATDEGNVVSVLSADRKSITMSCDRLELVYNDTFEEYTAEAITIGYNLPAGALVSPFAASFATDGMLLFVLLGVGLLAAAILCYFKCRTKREIVTVVNVKAPKEMDPLTMGKLIDGAVDTEDVTSMIYYFASKGYLMINLKNDQDPVLIRKVVELPEKEKAHAKTLFNGLFKSGDAVKVSELKYKYYETMEKAKIQSKAKDVQRYDKKSMIGCFICALLTCACAGLIPFIVGMVRVNGFADASAFAAAIAPILAALVLFVRKQRWHKLKKSGKMGLLLAAVGIAILGLVVSAFAVATASMTTWEKVITCAFAQVIAVIGVATLSPTEKIVSILGDILGFKDFIVYTEEDKIKFMLQDNPELMYDILPYAQVLGVSDEWESKFKGLTIAPPSWCVDSDMTLFDYMLFNHCMRASFRSLAMPPPSEGGKVGRSGGGGFFGGFSGGGHGGGGGGMR